jgi:hypothetical protein
MNYAYKALVILASLGLLIPLSGAVVYLPQTLGTTTPNPIADILSGFTLVVGSMVLGKILQWIIRMANKTKKGIVGSGVRP